MLYFDTSAVLPYYRKEHASEPLDWHKEDKFEKVARTSLGMRRTSPGSTNQ